MGKVHASLFSGFGAADLAATWMGWDNAFWCEIDDFPQTVLSYWFPKSKGYGNIKETDFTPWRGKIDILTGGFPCQPFSIAGQRKGQEDDRYLWPEMLRAIREIRPTWIIGENVGGILSMVQPSSEITVESQASLFEEANKETILEQEYVVETVCRDIEQEGYTVQPMVIPACAVEAPHRRDRVFFIAFKNSECIRCDSVESQKRTNIRGLGEFGTGNNEWLCGEKGIASNCSDSGVKSMQREGKDGISQSKFVANSECKGSRQVQQEIQSQQSERKSIDGLGDEWDVTYTDREQLENTLRAWGGSTKSANLYCKRTWHDFPTQSPVCRRNDGLPFDVVCLTISLTAWCTGAIKGYGNAIVPQVIYEIFKAIETIQK